jgi:UDP-glucose 6-dehydrogenase
MLWENLRVTLQVSVIGTNYLGATHAAGMAEFGHQVIGVDIDVDRVKTLNAGQSHIFEVGLEPLLERHTASGRLRFTTDYTEIADWADVHFLALGTPSAAGGAADLSQLHAAVDTLAPLLTKPTLVVGKSTVPVGTAMALEERLGARRRREMRSRWHGIRSSCARRTPWRTRFGPTGWSSEHTLDTLWTCWRRSMRCRSATVSPSCDATLRPAN